jgi:peptidylprolyl isomerase
MFEARVFSRLNSKECTMAAAKQGDTVRVHYAGRIAGGGAEFDSSYGSEPLEFTIGDGNIIPGFEEGILGMEPGDKKEISITCENAYGPKSDDLIGELDLSTFPDEITPEVGQPLRLTMKDGNEVVAVILEVRESTVLMDANHPLAGQDLDFTLELLEVV